MTLRTRLFRTSPDIGGCMPEGPGSQRRVAIKRVSPLQHPSTKNTGGYGVPSEITIIKSMIIAKGTVELKGVGTKETIRVWIMIGKEVTDPNPGAFCLV